MNLHNFIRILNDFEQDASACPPQEAEIALE